MIFKLYIIYDIYKIKTIQLLTIMDINKRNEISDRMKNSFVDDFDLINDAKEKINLYLQTLNIVEIYDYNNFCTDFINISNKMLDNLTITEFNDITIDKYTAEVLTFMIKHKITSSNHDEDTKSNNLIKLELEKYKK